MIPLAVWGVFALLGCGVASSGPSPLGIVYKDHQDNIVRPSRPHLWTLYSEVGRVMLSQPLAVIEKRLPQLILPPDLRLLRKDFLREAPKRYLTVLDLIVAPLVALETITRLIVETGTENLFMGLSLNLPGMAYIITLHLDPTTDVPLKAELLVNEWADRGLLKGVRLPSVGSACVFWLAKYRSSARNRSLQIASAQITVLVSYYSILACLFILRDRLWTNLELAVGDKLTHKVYLGDSEDQEVFASRDIIQIRFRVSRKDPYPYLLQPLVGDLHYSHQSLVAMEITIQSHDSMEVLFSCNRMGSTSQADAHNWCMTHCRTYLDSVARLSHITLLGTTGSHAMTTPVIVSSLQPVFLQEYNGLDEPVQIQPDVSKALDAHLFYLHHWYRIGLTTGDASKPGWSAKYEFISLHSNPMVESWRGAVYTLVATMVEDADKLIEAIYFRVMTDAVVQVHMTFSTRPDRPRTSLILAPLANYYSIDRQ